MNRFPEISRRNLLKAAAFAPFSTEALRLAAQEREIRITSSVLTYHEVNAAGMTSEVVGLIRRGYQPLSLGTFTDALKGDAVIPSGLSTFLVTCDDGLLSQYEQGLQAVDSIERQTGLFVPLTLFTMTRFDGLPLTEDLPDSTPSFRDNIHRYMNKGQLMEMIQLGHYVENHTIDHMDITRISGDRLRDQVELGEQQIDTLWDLAGRDRVSRAFAYPYGRYAGRTAYIESEGYDVAFTTVGSTQHSSSNRFSLGRLSRT